MPPEQQQQFEEMQRTLTNLKEVLDVAFVENIARRLDIDSRVSSAVGRINLGDLANVNDNATTGQVIKKQANGTWAGANDIDT